MSEADIKLHLIRLIDSQEGEKLEQLYDLICNQLFEESHDEEKLTTLEAGYRDMSEDQDRELDALDWIEGTLNLESL